MKSIKIILTAVALAVVTSGYAQSQLKVLRVTDITPELSVYPCGDRHEAMVVLRCQEPFDLILSSNYDANLDLTVTTEGPEKVYSIVFKTREEGTSFKGRQLTISAEGFQKYYIPLNLNDKEKFEYLVTDPYSKLRSLFYTATEEGVSLFIYGMYDQAIDKFNIAKQCPEYGETDNHIDEYIEQCDSLKSWMIQAQRYTDNRDYYNAKALYLKMLGKNPECTIIRELYEQASDNFNRVSKHDIEVAQAYFDTKRYDEARVLYEHAIEQNNPQSSLAGSNLAAIKLKRYKADNHTRSVSFVYEPDVNIGIMFAGLKPDKSSGYFSFGFERGCIDLMSQSLEPIQTQGLYPEKPMYQAMISAGWTFRLYTSNPYDYVPKVWALFSPFSYTAGGYYSKLPDPDNNKELKEDYHLMHAIAPEVGVAVRVWRVILSYRYQYRYVLIEDKPVSDNFGKGRNLIGLGFCW